MSNRRVRAVLLPTAAALVAAVLTGCGGTGQPQVPGAERPPTSAPSAGPTPSAAGTAPERTKDGRPVYVAVGASETVGVGADDPDRQAWPLLMHDTALPGSTYVNVGVSGSTVGDALTEQLPPALAAEPDVATVWLAVNDITHLVPVDAYEQQLGTLVHALRRGGETTVLVGNVPAVQDLPAYRACLPGAETGVTCALPVVPPEDMVTATVADFNAAIARVARTEGATVVDLARRDLSRLTADDGFHPSTEGHRRIATAFAHALDGGGR